MTSPDALFRAKRDKDSQTLTIVSFVKAVFLFAVSPLLLWREEHG